MNGSAEGLVGSLPTLVQGVFATDGVLSRTVQNFLPRQGQTDMALAVAETIAQGGVLVVEAGTGVGKTFAYLVPALLSGEKVLLSTATKTLQDQLFGRDRSAAFDDGLGCAGAYGLVKRAWQLSLLAPACAGAARWGCGGPGRLGHPCCH